MGNEDSHFFFLSSLCCIRKLERVNRISSAVLYYCISDHSLCLGSSFDVAGNSFSNEDGFALTVSYAVIYLFVSIQQLQVTLLTFLNTSATTVCTTLQ